jgi:hypothetical protein
MHHDDIPYGAMSGPKRCMATLERFATRLDSINLCGVPLKLIIYFYIFINALQDHLHYFKNNWHGYCFVILE